MRLILSVLLALLLANASHSAFAQNGEEHPVEVLSYAENSLGERLVYRIREEFRRSAIFRMANSEETRFQLLIQTMNLEHAPGESTAYSVTWVVRSPREPFPRHLDGILGYCTEDRIEGVAESIVAETDQLIGEFARTR